LNGSDQQDAADRRYGDKDKLPENFSIKRGVVARF